MDIDTIISRLDALGVTMTASGSRLDLRPGSSVPGDLQVAVRLYKLDLIDRLPPELPDDAELVEIVGRVWDQGYVLLWSNVLSDFVAFVRTDEDAKAVPRYFTVYNLAELLEVFGDEAPSPSALKLIHNAKKYGGKIISDE